MIEKLKFDVTVDELKTHLLKRAEYHRAQAKAKAEQLPALREMLESARATRPKPGVSPSPKMSSYNFDPDDAIGELEKDIASHHNRAVRFEFFAGHMPAGETYRLDGGELQQLEVLRAHD